MGTLRDEVYENLDYLSQLTEVVIGPQNVVLGRIPDRIELTFEMVDQFRTHDWRVKTGFEISVYKILLSIVPQVDWDYVSDIQKHFKFEVSEDFEIDLTNKNMIGAVALIKTAQQVDEKKLLEIALDKATRKLDYYNWPNKRLRDKVSTVLNTFEQGSGIEWAKKLEGRANWSGVTAIKTAFTNAIVENKWRIRDAAIIIKVGEWINSYLSDETDTSTGLVNLVKLKIMLEKDLPIYSIDEVKNANPA